MATSLVEMTMFPRSAHAGTRRTLRRKLLFGVTVAMAFSIGAHVAIADPIGAKQAQEAGLELPTAAGPDLVVAVAQPADRDWLPSAASTARLSRKADAETSVAGMEVGFSLGASAVRSGPGIVSNEILPSSPLLHPALVLFCGGLIGLGFLARGQKRRAASPPWQ